MHAAHCRSEETVGACTIRKPGLQLAMGMHEGALLVLVKEVPDVQEAHVLSVESEGTVETRVPGAHVVTWAHIGAFVAFW